MKQPDKFERMVEKIWQNGNEASGDCWNFSPSDVSKLLRRQHAAYVRMVRSMLPYEKFEKHYPEISEGVARKLLKRFAQYKQ